MVQAAEETQQSAGRWSLILVAYACGLVATAGMAQIAPLLGDIMRGFSVGPAAAGVALSAVFVASALGSTLSGWAVDRVGAYRIMWAAGALYFAADLGSFAARDILMFDVARCAGSLGFLGMTIAAPALIIGRTRGARQRSAMIIWSTFAPAAWIVGPLLSAPVAGTAGWQWSFVFHASLVALVIAAGLYALRGKIERHDAGSSTQFWVVLRNARAVRLAAAVGLSAFVGLGVNSVVPFYLVSYHGFTPATASSLLAFGSVINFAGGLAFLPISRALGVRGTGFLIVALAIPSIVATFIPTLPIVATIGGLAVALFAVGLLTALVMTQVPLLIDSPAQGGVISGLMSQAGAMFALAGGAVYGALAQAPTGVLLVSVGAWLLIAVLLPVWRRADVDRALSVASLR